MISGIDEKGNDDDDDKVRNDPVTPPVLNYATVGLFCRGL